MTLTPSPDPWGTSGGRPDPTAALGNPCSDQDRRRPQGEVRRARAYCGPSHGVSWVVGGAGDPPDAVEVPDPCGDLEYRLVRQPRTRRPARDSQGNYLYLPSWTNSAAEGRGVLRGSARQ
ncbi:MAG: hypothetical protein ABI873_07305 [Marmoricola sp.]